MKYSQNFITLLSMSLVAAGCGNSTYEKDPVPDLAQMREYAKIEVQKGPDKPRVITNDVLREKEVLVIRESNTIDEKSIVITPDSDMSFSEGRASQFAIRARTTAGLQINLKPVGFPEGAKLEKSTQEKDLYVISWTPQLNTIPQNQMKKSFPVKVVAQVISAATKEDFEKHKNLVKEKEFRLDLFKNLEAPANLSISGLGSEINEGTLTPITITVKVPGTDDKVAQKPRLVISYDGIAYTAGNTFLELDGSRHITADLNKLEPKYIGDSKWQFDRVFDTKNIFVQPQLTNDGSVLPNADGTRVRVSFKVYNSYGLSTPETLSQVKIKYVKTIIAPRFDWADLDQQGLQVLPGQKVILNFKVISDDSTAAVKVKMVPSTLPGKPTMTCQDFDQKASTQNCILSWDVPCDAKAKSLSARIEMKAQSVVNGQASEITSYAFKVVRSKEKKNLCSTEAAK